MITRSPPPRAVQTVAQPPSLTPRLGGGSSSNSVSLPNGHTSSDHHHPLGNSITATPSLAASLSNTPTPSRRPADAQNDYWLRQMAAVIAERDKARARATASEEAKATQISQLRQQLADERHQWKQTCNVLQAINQYTSLQQKVQLGNERWEALSRHEALASESQLAIIQRDGKIQQFQDAEFWLQLHVKDLQKAIDSLRSEAAEMSTNLLEQQESFEIKIAESEEELSALRNKVEKLEDYKNSNKGEIKQLKQTLASKETSIGTLEAEKESLSTTLNTTEQALRTAKAELAKQKKNDKRDDAEFEATRADKTDLELKVKKLEADLKEEKTKAKLKEKERKEAGTAEKKASAELEAQLEAANETIQNLKLRLKERPAAAVSKPEKKKKARDPSPVSEGNAPTPKYKPGKKSSQKESEPIELDDEDDDYVRRAATPSVSSDVFLDESSPRGPPSPAQPQRKPTTTKPAKPKPKAVPAAARGPSPHPDSKKQKKSNSAATAVKHLFLASTDDDEVAASSQTKSKPAAAAPTETTKSTSTSNKPRPTPRYLPKQSQQDNDGNGEYASQSKSKPPSPVALGKRRAPDEGPGVSGLTRNSQHQTHSRQNGRDDEGGGGVDEPKKKKKRILGGALGAAPSRDLQWSAAPSNGVNLGIDLPSMLSPVANFTAPPRSYSSQQQRNR